MAGSGAHPWRLLRPPDRGPRGRLRRAEDSCRRQGGRRRRHRRHRRAPRRGGHRSGLPRRPRRGEGILCAADRGEDWPRRQEERRAGCPGSCTSSRRPVPRPAASSAAGEGRPGRAAHRVLGVHRHRRDRLRHRADLLGNLAAALPLFPAVGAAWGLVWVMTWALCRWSSWAAGVLGRGRCVVCLCVEEGRFRACACAVVLGWWVVGKVNAGGLPPLGAVGALRRVRWAGVSPLAVRGCAWGVTA